MIKIKVTSQMMQHPSVNLAVKHLISLMHEHALSLDSHPIPPKLSNQSLQSKNSSPKKQISIKSIDIESWLETLQPNHRHLVCQLREAQQLSLQDIAGLLNLSLQGSSLKRQINGLFGSITRWSKKQYLTEIYQGTVTWNSIQQVKLYPPWYCKDGVYYWRDETG